MQFLKRLFKLILLFCILFICNSCHLSYNDSYKDISYLKISKQQNIKVDSIVTLFKNSDKILNAENERLYFRLKDSVLWCKIDLNNYKNKDVFVTLSEAFTEQGTAFLRNDFELNKLSDFTYGEKLFFEYLFYKTPTWYIPKNTVFSEGSKELYLKISINTWRNRREFFIQEKNKFLKRIEIEYLGIGLFISFMFSIVLILAIFSILKKEYSVLFYCVYIITVILEFISFKGIGQQLLWGKSEFLMKTPTLLYLEMAIAQAFFTGYFYKFTKKTYIFRKLLLILAWSFFPLLALVAINYYYHFTDILFNIVVISLQIIALFCTVVHVILLKEKTLPSYVVFFFILATFSHFIFSLINPSVKIALEFNYIIYNLRPILFALEMIAITRFIFDSVIKSQQRNHILTRINNELKINFQVDLIDVQEKERNDLLGNVHDSFGGYLEALKIRLSMNPSPEKLKEIIDSFYKEYRILLNNIYSPQVDNENFKQYLVEYLKKIEALDVLSINHDIDLSSNSLSREQCMHLYRIISEAFTNILKHAKATTANIIIYIDKYKCLVLEISDDGLGFENEIDKSTNSYGLSNINDRVNQLNGTLEISSSHKDGTHMKIILNSQRL